MEDDHMWLVVYAMQIMGFVAALVGLIVSNTNLIIFGAFIEVAGQLSILNGNLKAAAKFFAQEREKDNGR